MTFESSGKENSPAIAEANEDVNVVVTSFANKPFRPAARPLPIERYIQLAVIVGCCPDLKLGFSVRLLARVLSLIAKRQELGNSLNHCNRSIIATSPQYTPPPTYKPQLQQKP